jgi:hypothetical protein
MTDRTCAAEGCKRPVSARGLCRSHYQLAYRTKTLPPLQLKLGIHSLSNIDYEARSADCVICGPGVRVRVTEYLQGPRQGRVEARCMTVHRERRRRQRERRHKNRVPRPRVSAAAVKRRGRMRRDYGITPEDYERMYAEQGGRCAICQVERPRLLVDHNHTTRAVRGLLCRACNFALGFLRDNPVSAAAAAAYLTSYAPPERTG